ncbi:MAG: PorT family protein [Rikenellaceae bacterium]|jgi:hypothetical protein|nr:PorT family protein [Rikenellaceae bacterium]
MKDQFEQRLQEKLHDFTMKPAPDDWTVIERSLGIDVKVRKRVPLYRIAAAAAVLVLAIGVGGFFLFRFEPAVSPVAPLTALAEPEASSVIATLEQEILPENEALEAVKKLKETIDRANAPASSAQLTAMAVEASLPVSDQSLQSTLTSPNQPVSAGNENAAREQNNRNNTATRSYTAPTNGNFTAASRPASPARLRPNANWALSLFAGGMGNDRESRTGVRTMMNDFAQNGIYTLSSTTDNGLGSNYLIDYHPASSNAELPMAEVAPWNHALPLSFGFMLRRNLTDRWGIETGITYSYLASKQTTSTLERRQQLHYLGIPVAITYTPLRTSSFDIYLRAGGAADFNIAGRSSLTSGSSQPEVQHFTQKGVQWSLAANVGVMYNLSPAVGLYFEPGVSHYFPFSSQLDSYWKENPTSVNLKVGVRTSF